MPEPIAKAAFSPRASDESNGQPALKAAAAFSRAAAGGWTSQLFSQMSQPTPRLCLGNGSLYWPSRPSLSDKWNESADQLSLANCAGPFADVLIHREYREQAGYPV